MPKQKGLLVLLQEDLQLLSYQGKIMPFYYTLISHFVTLENVIDGHAYNLEI
jgi:hypothetical protein